MSHRVPGLVLTEHEVSVPLDHADPGGPSTGSPAPPAQLRTAATTAPACASWCPTAV